MNKKEYIAFVNKYTLRLPKLTDSQTKYFTKELNGLATTTRGVYHCLECGHKDKNIAIEENIVCPHCNTKTIVIDNKLRIFKESFYAGIKTTFKGNQVIRLFVVSKSIRRNSKPFISIIEVIQHWIRDDGYKVFASLPTKQFTNFGYYDNWNYLDEIHVIRNSNSYYAQLRRNIEPQIYYNHYKIIPLLKRNGYLNNVNVKDVHTSTVMSNLLKNNKYETLYKAGYYNLLTERMFENTLKYWNTIKICIMY